MIGVKIISIPCKLAPMSNMLEPGVVSATYLITYTLDVGLGRTHVLDIGCFT